MRKIVMALMLTTVLLFCAVSVAAEMAKEGTLSGTVNLCGHSQNYSTR